MPDWSSALVIARIPSPWKISPDLSFRSSTSRAKDRSAIDSPSGPEQVRSVHPLQNHISGGTPCQRTRRRLRTLSSLFFGASDLGAFVAMHKYICSCRYLCRRSGRRTPPPNRFSIFAPWPSEPRAAMPERAWRQGSIILGLKPTDRGTEETGLTPAPDIRLPPFRATHP